MAKSGNVRKGMSPSKAMEIFPESNDNNLKKIRVSKGLSQQDLADATGISKRTIQCYEQGGKNIDNALLRTLCVLSLGLDCKIEDILEDEELIELYQKCK